MASAFWSVLCATAARARSARCAADSCSTSSRFSESNPFRPAMIVPSATCLLRMRLGFSAPAAAVAAPSAPGAASLAADGSAGALRAPLPDMT
ncbi:MAG: hypothetical protein J3K34DRAFT_436743 [Monoraphidium minutum]|nr:MAG: hypothetical protein J3K34DRAFT_436743 [Monoraphidium minutum]